jgi:glycosyltransferase involved in cell wall biosynthesis
VSRPDLTVVLTTKDRPGRLRQAITSVLEVTLGQADVALELLVVDDGSSMRPDVPDDLRVHLLVHPTSRGANAARNTGLAAASGRWVLFLDDDDELIADGVHALLTTLQAANREDLAAIGVVVAVDEPTGTATWQVPRSLPRGTDWLAAPQMAAGRHAHNALIAPAAVLRRIGGFDEAIQAWTHDELFLRLLLEVDLVAVNVPTYRMYEDPRRPTLRRQHTARAAGIRRTLEQHDALHPPSRRATADLRSAIAQHLALAGDAGGAQREFAQALRAMPARRLTWVRIVRSLTGRHRPS